MSGPLSGRVAVVTGAARGIGRAIALELARQGCDVAFNYRSSDEAAMALVAEIEAVGRRALAVSADVGDGEAVTAFFTRVAGDLGPVDYLVNNAGISRNQLLMSMSEADWAATLNTNLTGAFLCAKAVIVPMMRRRAGRIVNVSSAAALKGLSGTMGYASSKAGMIGMTRSLAREVARYGITVNAVAPGFIETDMVADLPDKARAEQLAQIPLGQFGAVDDVAPAVAFLLGDGARYITGQVLAIDGGLSS